jgi:hypothetical protein
MVTFWLWGVRNPAIVFAGVCVVAGLTGVADEALSFSGILIAGVVADAANHLGRRALARQEYARAAGESRSVMQMFQDVEHDAFRKVS